jgi:putative flavoprotein involved in K+ transport
LQIRTGDNRFVGGVVVIGGGQAGLTVSRGLSRRGIEHVVLERDRVASAWRSRWDSFTLVTPNWTLGLPGSPYTGDDPEGHVGRDAIVNHLEAYATRWAVPVREGITVDRLSAGTRARFRLTTSDGPMDTDTVVVCTGAFQRPFRPPTSMFPPGIGVLDAADYRNPGQLPDGKVLVIGSGQTGC